MKKIYTAPSIEIVFVEVSNLMDTISGGEVINDVDVDAREGGLVWELEEINDEK
jgi:hypothetical protein